MTQDFGGLVGVFLQFPPKVQHNLQPTTLHWYHLWKAFCFNSEIRSLRPHIPVKKVVRTIGKPPVRILHVQTEPHFKQMDALWQIYFAKNNQILQNSDFDFGNGYFHNNYGEA